MAGITENEVKCLEPDMSPPEKVQQAVDCLQSLEDIPESPQLSSSAGQYWITPGLIPQEKQLQICVEDILKQATESTARHAQGEPISILDGVPVAIKDEIDCMPYPTTGGTKWMHKVRRCKNDACCVSRLRACGAIIVGKTNMHELGAGISGINPHYGAARNPYNRSKITGGSSSGSAAVVAAGLCPVALGVDGGGSVRLPAALCGVVGLKPTFARVPHEGYAAISGGLPSDHSGFTMPKNRFAAAENLQNLHVLRLQNGNIQKVVPMTAVMISESVALILLQNYQTNTAGRGDHTGYSRSCAWPHYLTIGSECSDSIASYLENINKAEIGWDVRVGLSVYSSFHSHEYLNAQRIRMTSPMIFDILRLLPNSLNSVLHNTIKTMVLKTVNETNRLHDIFSAALVRYQIAGNFLGSVHRVPVGYDRSGLPIGLQFIGKPWSESLLYSHCIGLAS
ncbi:UNVERIFIED_CONTAM: Fatty acid amide hydrolase [Sesamum latifolium]|uniref:Fatty acid amide hydrolase n=1 Tax=Sesamum latifolium TaxID=2727402 RepID=A0AAW2XD28_9LAMI